jgi:single-strand DNA-binding protein
MNGLNLVCLIGNLGRDCELRYTPGGAAVGTVNLAVSETWTDKQGQRQERTEWVRVTLWGKTAEALAEHLTKGKQIYVSGKMQTRSWDDKDGVKRYTTEVRGDKVLLLGGGSGRTGPRTEREPDPHGEGPANTFDGPVADDDIPF